VSKWISYGTFLFYLFFVSLFKLIITTIIQKIQVYKLTLIKD